MSSEAYETQKLRFQQDFCRKCEQARPLEKVTMTVSPNMIAMNKYDTQLRDLIHVEKGIIPANLCEYLVEEIEKNEWRPHTWYNNVANTFNSEETMELDVQNITGEHQQLLTPFMIKAGAAYNARYSFPCERTQQIMNKFSAIRFNRYAPD